MIDLNLEGESHAHSLLAAGRVDKASAWSFDTGDENALLGSKGDDWNSYSKAHLGIDRSASEKTKKRYRYPVSKNGKLYRSGVIAAKQRAAQQNDGAIEKAASSLLDAIDRPKSYRDGAETKAVAFEYKLASGADTGCFEGYGAVFDNEDSYGDLIMSGSFLKTLNDYQNKGKMPKMLLNHGSMGFLGSDPMADVPIGKWTSMSEDSKGLQVKGQLINLDTERGKTIHGAMKEGQLDGLSIGYKATDFTRGTKENEPRRTIKEIKLYEVSPVTFPANDQATVSAVKACGRVRTIREFEAFLRDEGGFGNAAAKAIAAGGFKAFQPDPRDEDGIGEAIAAPFRELARLIQP